MPGFMDLPSSRPVCTALWQGQKTTAASLGRQAILNHTRCVKFCQPADKEGRDSVWFSTGCMPPLGNAECHTSVENCIQNWNEPKIPADRIDDRTEDNDRYGRSWC